MSNRYFLYKFETVSSSEADYLGFAILTEQEKEKHTSGISKQYKDGGILTFGIDESHTYDDLDEIEETFEIEEITKQEYFTIKRLFGESYGELGPLDINGHYSNNSEDDEDKLCEVCGERLNDDYTCSNCEPECRDCGEIDDTGTGVCSNCYLDSEEKENVEILNSYITEIEKKFGIEKEKNKAGYYAFYKWNPTPLTTLEIMFESDESEFKANLYKGKKLICGKVIDTDNKDEEEACKEIKSLIKKSQEL